jgi:hypothetical protein
MPVIFVVLLMAMVAAGCESPESRRTRGDGPGADVGNRGRVVRMHEGSQPFWNTPTVPDLKHPPLDPAQQARELSRQ